MTRVLLAFAALLLLPISDAAAQPAKAVKVTVLSTITDLVITHNHGDHTGGLLTLRRELA